LEEVLNPASKQLLEKFGIQLSSNTVQTLRRLCAHLLVCKEPAQRCADPGPTEMPQLMLLGLLFRKQDASVQ